MQQSCITTIRFTSILMIQTENISETPVVNSPVTRLVYREEFNKIPFSQSFALATPQTCTDMTSRQLAK
jgi:hypothetical protein